jgi:hypothetical protein
VASTAQRLQRAGVRMEEYPQNVPNLTAAAQGLYELIKGRNIVSYPDPQLRLALSRAVAVEGSRGWKISKEKQRTRSMLWWRWRWPPGRNPNAVEIQIQHKFKLGVRPVRPRRQRR